MKLPVRLVADIILYIMGKLNWMQVRLFQKLKQFEITWTLNSVYFT
jgi:hypothetical protein